MNYKKFLLDVFRPLATDRFVFIEEALGKRDRGEWSRQHEMMLRWKTCLRELSSKYRFVILPDVIYTAPPDENAPLSKCISEDGTILTLEEALKNATVFIAFGMTSISATLNDICNNAGTLRGASMPGIMPEMEETALAADYRKMQRRCTKLAALMGPAEYGVVEFSTGHICHFDLRFRTVLKDDGYCGIERVGRKDDALINLPSGEVCQATYEGEIEGHKSMTHGDIPMLRNGSIVILHVQENQIVNVEGSSEAKEYFKQESGRCNIAEFAVGVNDRAIVRGNDLEDEKAGFHFAYGRSDAIGGTFGPEQFKDPNKICHVDVVYAKDCPIFVKNLWFLNGDTDRIQIYKKGELLI